MDKIPVFITGTSTGIGRAAALHLAAKGFRIFAGVRKKSDGDSLVKENPEGIEPVIIDVTKPELVTRAAEEVADKTGGSLYGLVNNAGVIDVGPIEYLKAENIRNVLNVNVAGMMDVTKNFLPLLRKHPGRIINIGSISGLLALPGLGIYAASKFAVEALTDSLRQEVRPQGISVSLIEPANTETAMYQKTQACFDCSLDESGGDLLYDWLFDAMKRVIDDPKNQPVKKVVMAIEHALTAGKPKNRYGVGRDALLFNTIRKLSPAMRDRLLAKVYGI